MIRKCICTALFLLALAVLTGCGGGTGIMNDSNIFDGTEPSGTIVNTEFAPGVVPSAAGLGMSLDEYLHGGDKGGFSYDGNRGCTERSVIYSPQYTLCVNGVSVPVYATIVHDGTSQRNVLTSFAIIEIKDTDSPLLQVELTPQSFKIKKAVVLPAAKAVQPGVTAGGSVQMIIREFGNFSVLANESGTTDFMSDFAREHSFTLFVRKYVDEDAEIDALRTQYGAENVTVYEPGLHEFDYVNIASDGQVLYFRRGCYMFARGRADYGEDNNYFEKHRGDDIGWNLNRFPVLNANGRKDIVIAGNGWIDAGGLGWHERRGVLLSYCDGITVKGITFINFPEWTFITYVSKNIAVSDCRIYGYKTNSDGFAICNSVNASVSDCFARSGDDLFEIKTLGGPADAVADNVTFTSCTAWASKARCFGIIAETERDVSNITFRDCSVICRDSTWDNDFLGSLMVYCEASKNGVTLDNILFENVEIWCDRGRAINVKIEDDKAPTHVTNVTFRNVSYNAALKNLLYSPEGDYVQEITFDNVCANGITLDDPKTAERGFDRYGNGTVRLAGE